MKLFTPLFLLLLLVEVSFSQAVVVNEVFNGFQQKTDWVELLVIQNNLDLRNYQVRDFSSAGNPQAPLIFSNNSYWNGIKQGTLIVITGDSSVFAEDTSKDDFTIQLRFKGIVDTTYFRGNQFNIATASDAVHARTSLPDTLHVHGIAWGSNNINSLPAPRAYNSGQLNGGVTALPVAGASYYFTKLIIMTLSDFGVDANLFKDTLGGTRGYPNDSVTLGGNYLYILSLRTSIGIRSNNKIVNDYRLYQNYPNPFNPATTIEFDIPKNAFVTLDVYDVLGRKVSSPVSEDVKSGSYNVTFYASDLSSGVYYYKLTTAESDGNIYTDTKTMILVK